MENKITMIAGSLPAIVTRGNNRRVNKDGINDPILKMYVGLIGKLLITKKDITDIKFVYIGGYEGIENINTAKLYFSALNYYLESYGYKGISKNNFTIVDKNTFSEDPDFLKEKIQNADFLFLGIGDDKIFIELINILSRYNVDINRYAKDNNMVVASVCAGSVISATKIYGGNYDAFYHERETVKYPSTFKILGLNRVTIEPNLYPVSSSDVKNMEFKNKYLIPDSYKISFFGCRGDSFIYMCGDAIYAIGEIYLFIDGKDLLICGNNQMVDISKLNELVNLYNLYKDKKIKDEIEKTVYRLIHYPVLISIDSINMESFIENEKNRNAKEQKRKEYLKINLIGELIKCFYGEMCIEADITKFDQNFITSLNLETDSDYEIYLKFWIIKLIKRYSKLYNGNISKYFDDLYEIMDNLVSNEPLIVYYFLGCFSSMYENCRAKRLLAKTNIETNKRVSALNSNNLCRKRLWQQKSVS